MILIQITAAALLVLGSALLIHALVSLDETPRPRGVVRPRIVERGIAADLREEHLPRAA